MIRDYDDATHCSVGRWVATGIISQWFARRRTRGAAVPFEAPALNMARVCDDERDGLIAVLRDFANNGTAYIVPWTSLPLMVTMTDHDMAVHQAVGETRATTPEQVRSVVSKLALSDALGPEAKAREQQQTSADQSRLADVEMVLILHLLNSSGAELETLMANATQWRDADAKAAVAAAAAAVGMRRQDIYQRIAEFAGLLAPIGLIATEGTIQSGWLRVLRDEIEGFARSLPDTAPPDLPNAGTHLAAIADAASRTAQLASLVFGMIDYAVLDIGGTIRRWDTELPVLRRAIERLSLMLDEWPSLMKSVHDALRAPPHDVALRLRQLRAVLPRMPEAQHPDGVDERETPAASRILAAKLSTIWSMLSAYRSLGMSHG